jgi:hypothetical protein
VWQLGPAGPGAVARLGLARSRQLGRVPGRRGSSARGGLLAQARQAGQGRRVGSRPGGAGRMARSCGCALGAGGEM